MYLKRLCLQGFKSFADRTLIGFYPGITAIVGPNGCGKSNLVEAVLWVCGEQSARTLRGERMEDVIFHGGGLRRPLGMAEVTLTLEGVRGRLPAPLGEQETLEITRRLFRSGESEYLLNQIPCRLKDIREVLLDLGIGLRGHAIVEQGRVEQVLQMSPEERRLLVEEVAGILKFRVQRTEALRKLEATRNNLERIRDVIQEVRQNRDRLERQVRRVRRHQELLAQLRRVELSLFWLRDQALRQQLEALEAARSQVEASFSELEARTRKIEAHLQQVRVAEGEARERYRQLQEAVQAGEESFRRMVHREEVLRHQQGGLRQQRERLEEEVRRDEEALRRVQAAWQEREAQLQAVREAEVALAATWEADQGQHRRLSQERASLQQALEQARQQVFSATASLSEVRNQLQRYQQFQEEAVERQRRLEHHLQHLRQGLEGVTQRLQQTREGWAALGQALQRVQDHLQVLGTTRDRQQEEASALRERLQEQQQQFHRLEARYQSLLEVDRQGLGLEEGPRRLLAAREGDSSRWQGIHGLVAHFLEVPPQLEVALEAALGQALQGIVVEDLPHLLEALQVLRQEGWGQGLFLPRRRMQGTREARSPLPDLPGVVGWALDHVQMPPSLAPVIEPLLEGVVLVEDLKAALEGWERLRSLEQPPRVLRWVTLEGEVVEYHGAVVGGTTRRPEGSLLARRRLLRELEGALEALQGHLEKTQRALQEVEAQQQQLEAQIQIHEGVRQSLQMQWVQQERDLAHLEQERARLQDEIRGVEEEWEDLNGALEAAREAQQHQTQELEVRHLQEQAARRAFQEAQERLRHFEARWEAFQEKRVNLYTQRAKLEERRQALERELEDQARRLEALRRRRSHRLEEIQSLRKAEQEKEEERRRLQTHCHDQEAQLRQQKEALQAQEARVLELEQQRGALEQEERQRRRQMEALRNRLGELRIQEATLRLERSRIQESLEVHYRCSLEGLEGEVQSWEERTLPEAVLEEQVQALREKLERVGPVDPSVLEAYQEVADRLEFLEQQEADLVEAAQTLQQTIQRINRTTRERFLEAFEALNGRFQELFRTLFEGGEARLVLTRPEDPLETGVDIQAQPTGKRIRHLSQLSGGEKALTAIALILAGFLIRPAPFCILDEIDAPLDEANTGRFLNLLEHLRGTVQFLLITHNKRTMEAADRLYGVTMEEPGVSKVLSVDLSRAAALQAG